MQLFHHYHHQELHKFFHTDFWKFELSVWLHVLALSTISVFVPIFLLNMGWSLGSVMLYYVILNSVNAPMNFVAKHFIYRIGARKVIIIGTFFYIVFFGLLYNLTAGNWPLLAVMAVLAATYDAFYWVGHIYYFMKCEENKDDVAREVGLMHIAKRVAGIMAPLFGAAILVLFHKNVLIVISMALFALSAWPLFRISGHKDRPETKPKSLREYFAGGDGLREYLLQSLYAFHGSAEYTIWPIFIYLLFESVESVALIPAIVSVSMAIFIYFVGRIRRVDRSKAMAVGALCVALIWASRMLWHNDIFFYASVFVSGIFSILVSMPLESTMYEKGEKKDALATSAHRNFFSMAPRILLYATLFVLVEVFHVSFTIAALAMLGIMFASFLAVYRDKQATA